jgi:hypothetical protein
MGFSIYAVAAQITVPKKYISLARYGTQSRAIRSSASDSPVLNILVQSGGWREAASGRCK